MSIEAALAENTAALNRLAAALQNQPTPAEAPKPTAGKPATSAKPPQAPKPAATPAQPAPAAAAVTYKDAESAVLHLAKTKGRDAAVKLLAAFKGSDGKACTNLKQVAEKDWGALVEQSKAAA